MPTNFRPNLQYFRGNYGHCYSRLEEVKKIKNVDILFLGSSHSYRGFDTRIFERKHFKSFNLGSSGQTPIQTLVLLNRYLERLNPKLIVYEVFPDMLSATGVESALDIISNDKNDIQSWKMAFKMNHLKVYNTLLYSSMNDIFKIYDSYYEPRIKGEDTYVSGGFVEKEIKYNKPKPQVKTSFKFNEKQLSAFKNILDMIKSRDIKLILVYAPIPKTNYRRYLNNNEIDSMMEGYSSYYNFNKLINLNDSLHFYDSNHLNQLGVEIFNKELIKVIKE